MKTKEPRLPLRFEAENLRVFDSATQGRIEHADAIATPASSIAPAAAGCALP